MNTQKAKILYYVINLDGSNERLANVTQTLSEQGIDFIRISAFDGRQVDPTSFDEYSEPKALAYMGRTLTGGELGCYFSHLNCAKVFLESDADFVVVLEDDMKPSDDLAHKINMLIQGLADEKWHLINIGANKRKIFTPLFKIGEHQVSHAHYFPMTTTGVVWNKNGARAFLEQGLPIYAPVDNFFRDWLTKSNLGIGVYPPLVVARDVASDIDHGAKRKQNNRTKNYGFLKQKRLWQDKIIAFKHKFFGVTDVK